MKAITCILIALCLSWSLGGCGQSGPLYVPGDPSSIKAPPEPAEGEEQSEDSEDNGEEANRP